MRIHLSDLIEPGLFYQIPAEHQINLNVLFYKVSLLRQASQLPFYIRDDINRKRAGYRTQESHKELYAEINLKRARQKLPALRVPEYSLHLVGAACDIFDPDQKLQMWIRAREPFCRTHGLWFESFSATENWVHMQFLPPASGVDNLYFHP